MWKYSHQNIKISDSDSAHFSMYAIGGTYDHEHGGACECCKILKNFLNTSFESFINGIVPNQINDDQI